MKQKIGAASILTSGVLMGTLPVFVRSINLHAFLVTFFRFFVGFIFLALFFLLKNKSIKIKYKKLILLLSLANVLTVFFYICSLQIAKVAISALLLYMAPVYVMLIVFMREWKIEFETLFVVILSIIGLYLMLRPCKILSHGIICGFLSGITYSFVFVLAKEARKLMSAQEITFFILGFGALFLLPVLLVYRVNNLQLPWIIGIGLIPTAIPFTLFNYGIKYCKVEKASVLALIEPISVAIIGYAIFDEVFSSTQILGTSLILISISLSLRKV